MQPPMPEESKLGFMTTQAEKHFVACRKSIIMYYFISERNIITIWIDLQMLFATSCDYGTFCTLIVVSYLILS